MAASFHIQGEGGKQAEKLRADSMSAHNENPKSGSINLNTFINMVSYKYFCISLETYEVSAKKPLNSKNASICVKSPDRICIGNISGDCKKFKGKKR